MSFDDLRRLWSEITPLFSVGAALTIPALRQVRILKQVAPIAVSTPYSVDPLFEGTDLALLDWPS